MIQVEDEKMIFLDANAFYSYYGRSKLGMTSEPVDEELALTLNGRKKKLQREDFIRSAATLGIENVIVERLINKYIKLLPKFETVIKSSFLSAELKEKYGELLKDRLARLSQGL